MSVVDDEGRADIILIQRQRTSLLCTSRHNERTMTTRRLGLFSALVFPVSLVVLSTFAPKVADDTKVGRMKDETKKRKSSG